MPSPTDRTAGEVDWPAWADRTPPRERTRTSKFSVTLHQAIDDLETELENRLDVDDWRLSTAAPHRKSDGLPYADSNPDDPAVAVRWSKDGEQYCVAADEYTRVRDNVRAIGLYISEKRKMSNRPVRTGQDEFATARLPSGDEDDDVVAVGAGEPDLDDDRAAELLGVSPDASDRLVKTAFEEQVKRAHGDQGGNLTDATRLQEARDTLLDR